MFYIVRKILVPHNSALIHPARGPSLPEDMMSLWFNIMSELSFQGMHILGAENGGSTVPLVPRFYRLEASLGLQALQNTSHVKLAIEGSCNKSEICKWPDSGKPTRLIRRLLRAVRPPERPQ